MNDDLHSLAAVYALDALDPVERTEFEAHLADCDRCTAEVAEFGEVVATIAGRGVVPPARLKSAVMSQLDAVDQVDQLDRSNDAGPPTTTPTPATGTDTHATVTDLTERRRRTVSIPALLAAAAAVALIVVGAVVTLSDRSGSGFDDVAASADAVVIRLDGEGGTFEVAYSARRDQVALRSDDVADLAPGLRYALWAIDDGASIPAGLFEPDDGSIEGVAELADVSAEAWGVTVEPETGSDVPTPPIIAVGEV
jgi:anti-sigma factor RsiW